MADKPGFLDNLAGIINPGGDPDAVRRAAAACRKLATDLEARLDAIDPYASGLQDFWEGKDADGFQRTWKRFGPGLTEYTGHFEEAAKALDRIADVIHEAQVKANHLKAAMAVTAGIGIVVTVFSFGSGAGLTAAALEAEAGAFAIWVAETIGVEIATIQALLIAVETTTARFALGAGASAVAVGGVKGANGVDPFDPANWSADDVTHVLFDGALTAGVGVVADLPRVGAALEAHPYAGAAAAGAVRSGTASALGQFWLNGNPITDLEAWGRVGASAAVSGISGVGVARVFNGSAGDLTRGLTGVPSGVINYSLNFPQPDGGLDLGAATPIGDLPLAPPDRIGPPDPKGPAFIGPTPPVDLDPPASIDPPRPDPHDPDPAQSAGTYTVRPGDSLWAIAARRLGDPTLWPRIAEANGIGEPYIIHPDQRLRIPSLT